MLRAAFDHRLAASWALLTAAALLTQVHSLPAAPSWVPPALATVADKAVHFALFLVLPRLTGRSLAHRIGGRSSSGAAVTLSGGYGLVLELAQMGVPGRGWEWADLAAAGAGIPLGWAARRGEWGRRRGWRIAAAARGMSLGSCGFVILRGLETTPITASETVAP